MFIGSEAFWKAVIKKAKKMQRTKNKIGTIIKF